ncbi:hypothetical protein I203_106840 [Kwoniella mangroviensis CBS 8507]|uniref:uncharacterized protein n=1 Tax=Kwoniella mangroviensis CBS 8507 TaxID=1296122 RepID=UPI003049B3E0
MSIVAGNGEGSSNDPKVEVESGVEASIALEVSSVTNPAHVELDSLKAWLVVFGCCGAMTTTFGLTTSFGVFQEYYGRVLLSDQSASSIAWIGGLQYCLLFFLGLPIGSLNEKGYTRQLVWSGSIIIVCCQVGISFCSTYHQLLIVQGLLFGIGSGCVFTPACAVVQPWFDKKRNLAMGILATGSAIGGVIFSLAASNLLPQIGFAWTARVLALLSLIVLIIASLFVRQYPGLPENRSTSMIGAVTQLKKPAFSTYILGVFLASASVYAPVNYAQEYGQHLELPKGATQYLVTIINGTSIIGRIGGGQLADHFGSIQTETVGVFICGTMCFFWTKCTSSASLIAYAALYGVAQGVYVALLPAGAAAIIPSADLGRSIGVMFSILSIAMLISQPVFGLLIRDTSGPAAYSHAAIFGGSVLMLSALSLLISILLRPRTRNMKLEA